MNNEQLLADLDEGHDDLFILFRDRINERCDFSQGALIHAFESLLQVAITAARKGEIVTWESVHAILEHFVNGNIDDLVRYAESQRKRYDGSWTPADDTDIRERLNNLLGKDEEQE